MPTEADIVDDIVAEEPEADRPLEELQNEAEPGTTENNSGNAQGTPNDGFDPSIHATDEHGNPKKNADGTFSKRRGRKPGSGNGKSSANPEAVVNTEASQAQALGVMTAQVQFALCQGFIGPEWKPTPNEECSIATAWGQYYLATGRTDMPPSMIVLAATLSYAHPRLQAENTQSKLRKFINWFKVKILRRKTVSNEETK